MKFHKNIVIEIKKLIKYLSSICIFYGIYVISLKPHELIYWEFYLKKACIKLLFLYFYRGILSASVIGFIWVVHPYSSDVIFTEGIFYRVMRLELSQILRYQEWEATGIILRLVIVEIAVKFFFIFSECKFHSKNSTKIIYSRCTWYFLNIVL